ncbi:hypothetical protein ACHAWO_003016 [Cyclotella atomus]|jgi:hypothetical protein|uniref:Uncharacterized protein n=1 Tax=Cyclotella atomus TaxID=382360 RepID=A0ABD3R138_9STRA
MKDLQSNFDKKLADVKSKLFKVERELIESKGKNKSMEKKISVLQMKFKSHLLNESINSDAQVPDGTIKVSGAGIVQVNGLYIEHGKRDGVPQYVKTGIWDGSDVIFKLLRDDGWYILMYISIVDPDIAFYVHTNDDDTPPKKAGKMTMKV